VTVAVALVALGLPAAALGASAPVLTSSLSNSTSLSGLISVAVSGQDAYTTAYWPGQLAAIDISHPGTLSIAGETPATTSLENGSNVTIAGTDAFVVSKNRNASISSNDDGSGNSLTEVDISNPSAVPLPILGSVHDPPGPSSRLFGSYGVAVQSHYAYVASQGILGGGQPTSPDTSTGEFSVIDLSTTPISIVGHIDNTSPASTGAFDHPTSVAISPNGNYAYVTSFNNKRVTVVDITNPLQPSVVTSVTSPAADLADPVDLAVQGHYLYVANQADFSNQLTIMDISNPASPQVVGTLNNGALEGAYRIRVRGDFAYLSASDVSTIAAIDITDPTHPRLAGSLNDPAHLNKTTGLDLDSSGQYVVATSAYTSAQMGSSFTYPPFATDTGTISMIQLDPNPIAVSIATPSEPPNPTAQTTASFTFSVNDDVSAPQCQLDNGPMGLCSTATTANYSSLSAGSHTFTVQATDAAGNISSPASYTWTVGSAPVNSSPPTVSGSAVQGKTLTASTGSWSGAPAPSFSYQWERCNQSGQACNPISGAPGSGSAYVVQSGDVGQTLVVVVTATNAAGAPTAQSQPTAVVQSSGSAPANSAPPTVSGTAALGKALTASKGTWSGTPAPTFSYQWERCNQTGQSCTAISGATSASYVAQRADVGLTVRAAVTGSNSAGSSAAPSAATARVSGSPLVQSLPTVSGTAQPGAQLTGSNGTWSGYPAPSFTYRWERCNSHGATCKTISGQTKSGYTVASGDLGSTLRFVVVAANASGSSTATSAATAVVSASSGTAQAVTGRAILTGTSTGRPSLRITIPAGHGTALVKAVDVSLPTGIRFSGSKSHLVKEVTVKTAQGKRLGFVAALKHGGLLITFKRAADGVQVVISSRALSVSKHFLATAKGRHASSPQVALTLAETTDIVMHGRLKLRLTQ
jgi:hypothetical protein